MELSAAWSGVVGLPHHKRAVALPRLNARGTHGRARVGPAWVLGCSRRSALWRAPGAHRERSVPGGPRGRALRSLRRSGTQLLCLALLPALLTGARDRRIWCCCQRLRSWISGLGLVGAAAACAACRCERPVQGDWLHDLCHLHADGAVRLSNCPQCSSAQGPLAPDARVATDKASSIVAGCLHPHGLRGEVPAHRGHLLEHVSTGQPNQL
mmetsp:Transcript_131307/g.318994  ORF Transcript_131307/g.318994 Transcript_131307/m.318994 type:complete len:211 (-) Transcript_131307:156-788(-)